MRPGWFLTILFALAALLPLTGCGLTVVPSDPTLQPIVADPAIDRQRPVDAAKLLSCWVFEQRALDGKTYYYTYTFRADHTLVQTRVLSDFIQSTVATYRYADGGVTITWPNNGGIEQGTLNWTAEGLATYRITAHTTDKSQVGMSMKMSRILADGTTAVVTLRNPTAAAIAVEMRWVKSDQIWTPWQTRQVPANQSWDFWLHGAYHCQVRYNGTPNAGHTQKYYDVPANVVPRTDQPGANAGRRFAFQNRGGVLELFAD